MHIQKRFLHINEHRNKDELGNLTFRAYSNKNTL